MAPLVDLAGEVTVILTALSAICVLIYWALSRQLKEEFLKVFMTKDSCVQTHAVISTDTQHYRDSVSASLSEIKDMIKDIQEKFYDFIREGK